LRARGPDRLLVDCSVLVPVFNERDHIVASVAAMRRQRFSGEIEFLLVDGGSTDGTREVLARLARQDPRIVVLDNPSRHIPAGLNIALAHARGRWVARMDAHSHYPADYLERGIERLRRGDVRWVSGPQLPVGAGAVGRATALALATPLGRGGSRRWAGAQSPEVAEYDLDSGVFCGVWERETLLALGGWDERWPRNEDSEMAARFMAGGDRLVCLPAMAARYTPRDSFVALWRQYRDNGYFRAQTARWHPETLRRSNLLPPGLAVAAAASLAGPALLRGAARAGLGAYASLLAAAGVRAYRNSSEALESAYLPGVLAVMHGAYGIGFLRGALRHGVPWAALSGAAGLRGLAARLTPAPRPVHAPSLHALPPAGEPGAFRRAA
jgi:succinoglycan biosynthesis protein ExoA